MAMQWQAHTRSHTHMHLTQGSPAVCDLDVARVVPIPVDLHPLQSTRAQSYNITHTTRTRAVHT